MADPKNKRFMWMDGIVRDSPDPNWDMEVAIQRGWVTRPSATSDGAMTASPSFEALKADARFTRQVFNLDTADDHTPND